ncbi:MAG TPA: FtsX-like permease family protein [Myxococcota bacterium]|nr:FtsX-like permease family protein [Myxococcota bacterium]
MEKRRTWKSFWLVTTTGVLLTLGFLLGGEYLLRVGWKGVNMSTDTMAYLFLAGEGMLIGGLLGLMVGYYPSLEGLICSLVIVVRLLVRDDFQLGLDNFVEVLLKFESHFAMLYLTAFVLFLARGGGLYYPFFVGMRYLRFKMITAISVAGVALGVAAMVVVLSVMSGFEMDLKDKIVGTNAHAIVQKRGLDFSEWPLVIEKAKHTPGVLAATPFVYNEVMVSSEFNISGVFIKGIDPLSAGKVTDLDSSIEEGELRLLLHPEEIDAYIEKQRRARKLRREKKASEAEQADGGSAADRPADGNAHADAGAEDQPRPKEQDKPAQGNIDIIDSVPPAHAAGEVPAPAPLSLEQRADKTPAIFIGKELLKILKVRLGDRVNIVSPLSEELGPSGPVPRARSFRVAGVFVTGMYEYDAKSVYISLKEAQGFFGMGDAVTGVALRFNNIDRAAAICKEIISTLDGYPYFTRTWYQMNKNLFTALKMEKVGMFILVVIVTLVSAFGIISTLIMLVWEKVKEIAILKSMGSTGDGVMKIFMFEGITIGMVGTGLGLLLGWGVCILLRRFGMQLDPEVYYIENLPVNMDLFEFILIAGIALHISFIATIYPSRRASRLSPAEGLRYD